MKSKFILHTLLTVLVLGMWGCQDLPQTFVPPGGGGTGDRKVRINGTVTDLNSAMPVSGVTIYKYVGSVVDSTLTDANGSFAFEFDVDADSVSVTLSLKKIRYLVNNYTFVAAANAAYQLDLRLTPDLSTSAIVFGVVRDSSTLYPLRNSNVLYAVPGYSEPVVTSIDGQFTFVIDLVDQDSVPVVFTVSHAGFQSKQVYYVVHRGTTTNLGNLLLRVDAGSSVGQVLGRVIDAQSRQPIINASVVLTSSLVTDSALTSGDGAYSFSIDLQGLVGLSGSLRVTKNGYRSRTASFSVIAGNSSYNDVFLDRDTTTGVTRDSGTGTAHSIALVSVSSKEISVLGVGGLESSILIWEVRDSLGFPIDIDHRDTVTFQIFGAPVVGGAYVSPDVVMSNVSGRVATTVNSGTVSGVIQFEAKLHRETDGVDVISTPVLITVNAGLPHQNHFTIGPDQFNFAGYDWVARTNGILVQVGDRWSNPVKTGTAVYFNSTGGVITASGFTDATSHARVTLYSGNPLPMFFPRDMLRYPAFLFGDSGKGYCQIYAHSLGENNVDILDSTLVCFSGRPQVSFSINTFRLQRGGQVSFAVTVSDENGNPLAPGTTIELALAFNPPPLSGWSAISSSNFPEGALDDYLTRGPGATDFAVTILDGTAGGTPDSMAVVASVKVDGPNGKLKTSIFGKIGLP
jgi:hypothetical protein